MMLKLVPYWRRAHKIASVQVAALASAVWGVWQLTPPPQQAEVLAFIGLDPTRWIPVLGFAGMIVARLVAQPNTVPPPAEQRPAEEPTP